MHLSDFDYHLPQELIARYPLEKRSASRLLCLPAQGALSHQRFEQILEHIQPGDLLVFNDTKVIPARLFGKKLTGGKVEVFIERVLDNERVVAQVRASKKPHVGDQLQFAADIYFEVLSRKEQFYELKYTHPTRSILDVFQILGEIPLPHYMQREVEESDKTRYQTVYAKHQGSVAAPTAGLHFDAVLLQKLRDKQVNFGYLTLHIGAGTFMPVRTENIAEHKMHPEYLVLSEELATQIAATKAAGKRVIAVGTTSMRSLETASQSGATKKFTGDTDIFIYPGYEFKCVDVLITNLHLPGSTLIMLVSAFAGHAKVMSAYKEAVAQNYRFFSYGDAMWVERKIV